jgi:hypothetical protein
MPCNQTPCTLENRITDFSARYILNGPYSGSVTLADCDCSDDPGCSEICRPIEVSIDSTTDVVCCEGTSNNVETFINQCYQTDPNWISGLLRSFSRDLNNVSVSASVSSYFEYLRSKPVNTQQFINTQLSVVLDTIFTYYTGTPAGFVCIDSFTDTFIRGPVEGNDSLAELALLAQAGKANLFVQVGGCLTIDEWKDHNSPVDLVIPPELIINATPAEYRYPNTTVIRVRGAAISKLQCGEQTLTNNSFGPGSVRKCVFSGVPSPVAQVSFNNLSGVEQDIRNANIASPQTSVLGNPYNIDDGAANIDVILNSGAWFDENGVNVDFLFTGQQQSFVDEAIFGFKYGPNYGGGYGGSRAFFDNYQQILAGLFPVPYSAFGLGAFGSQFFTNSASFQNNQSYSDQTTFQQVETVASANNLLNACGVKYEDIQNKYVYSKELLFDIAVRRFQEIILAQNTWNVELPYLPCLRLNQVVQFTTPATSTCPAELVTGIVGGIDIDHSTDNDGAGETTMRLAVMDVSCLGQTEYRSGNLIESFCAGTNTGDLNPWQSSALDIDTQAGVSNCGYMFTAGTANAFLEYQQANMEIGATYEYSFDYTTLAGGSNTNFEILGSGLGPVNITGTGTQSGTFNATANSVTFQWDMLPGLNPTYMTICNVTLIKVVTA